MTSYDCPHCEMFSNRKYNVRKHLERKHEGSEIPSYLLSSMDNNSKCGKYVCPYCEMSSNRKYNMKKHLERKHEGSEIPSYLLSSRDNYNNKGYIDKGPQNFDGYLRGKHKPSVPLYNTSFLNNPSDDNILSGLFKHKKDKNSHSIIWEILQNIHLLENLKNMHILHKKNFPLYNPILNSNFLNFYKNCLLPSMDLIPLNKEILLRVQRCNNCNIGFFIMFPNFDNIILIIDYCIICRSQKQNNSISENNSISYLTAKEYLIKLIMSFIDKDKNVKIYLKCINISSDIYNKLVIENKQFFYNDKENGNIPSWMITYIMNEEWVDLGVIENYNWAYRLTNNNEKSIEITKSELIEFINYGDSTFGLFKFHKDNIGVYFFSYLQIERIKNP
ncbi:MAG TPA: hypothetical protein VFP49_12950 [Nitrososphaeraceae archaeon]|nr:hypothetical protein [Nitrososphaeraceae archaeon]